jgi:hypothetical protein
MSLVSTTCVRTFSSLRKAWISNRLESIATRGTLRRRFALSLVGGVLVRTHESLARRLAHELADIGDRSGGDGVGGSIDRDGEVLDNQVGGLRAGRLIALEVDPTAQVPITARMTSASMAVRPPTRRQPSTFSTRIN